MKTLIITDVQNDFVPGGTLSVPGGNEIVPVINKIQHEFDLVIATQDWHPHNHTSFASNHKNKKPLDKIEIDGIEQVLWPDHCVQGSEGAEFHPGLETDRIEAIIRKGMDPEIDSYSGFYDNHHKKSTGLTGYLKNKGAKLLYFCGLAADYCVYYSIKDAVNEGFIVKLIYDATVPIDHINFDGIKNELSRMDVELVHSSRVSKKA